MSFKMVRYGRPVWLTGLLAEFHLLRMVINHFMFLAQVIVSFIQFRRFVQVSKIASFHIVPVYLINMSLNWNFNDVISDAMWLV